MLKKKTVPQVIVAKNILATTSMNIAEVFGKKHYNILQSIENLKPNLPTNFWELNFQFSNYESRTGKNTVTQNPMYLLTRDAFTLLVMGFTGKKALQFKLAYIAEFNRMQKLLAERQEQAVQVTAKAPELTLIGGQLFATSLNIADVFDKQHRHVLRDIRHLQRQLDPKFYSRNDTEYVFFNTHFQESTYQNANGVECPLYYLSRTGLSLLLMTYTSPKTLAVKRRFLETFLDMEQEQKMELLPPLRAALSPTRHCEECNSAAILNQNSEKYNQHEQEHHDMSNKLTRYENFRMEMLKNKKIWKEISAKLGLSVTGCIMAIQRETIKKEHYEKLLEMGFSESVLPRQITK